MYIRIVTQVILILLVGSLTAQAEVSIRESKLKTSAEVTSNDSWQPEGFEAFPVLHAPLIRETPVIDGLADDPAWTNAEPLVLSLDHGSVAEASVKAVYTDKEVFLLVSWPDPDKDDQHRPWVLNAEQGRYVESPQIEDSVLVTIEGGCDWSPSPLQGYVFDFDGWRWLAARSDPLGQAVDINGHALMRGIRTWSRNTSGVCRNPTGICDSSTLNPVISPSHGRNWIANICASRWMERDQRCMSA